MAQFSQSNASQGTAISTVSPLLIQEPHASKVFRIVFFSLISLASFLGNSIMLKAASKYPSRKPLSYHLVTNLAAAEIINTLCTLFTFVYVYLRSWPFGEFACKVIIPLQVLSLFVVTNTLAAIAVYRFVFVVFQLRITVTYRKLILLVSLLWLVALAVCMPLFIFQELVDKGNVFCIAEFETSQTYEITRFILNYGLPYMVMVVSYSAMALKLRQHSKRIQKGAEMSALGEKTQEEDEPTQQQDTEAIERRKSTRAVADLENDLLRMIYVVIIVFAVCYLPYQLYYLLTIFGWFNHYPEARKYQKIIQQYCMLLRCLSSALHPLCYGTMSRFYARSFSWLVLCRCKLAN